LTYISKAYKLNIVKGKEENMIQSLEGKEVTTTQTNAVGNVIPAGIKSQTTIIKKEGKKNMNQTVTLKDKKVKLTDKHIESQALGNVTIDFSDISQKGLEMLGAVVLQKYMGETKNSCIKRDASGKILRDEQKNPLYDEDKFNSFCSSAAKDGLTINASEVMVLKGRSKVSADERAKRDITRSIDKGIDDLSVADAKALAAKLNQKVRTASKTAKTSAK
jgi:hypothetical protein